MAYSREFRRPGPARFRYGGRLALDFVNTVDNRVGPTARDDLPDYGALLSWAWQVEVLDDRERGRLNRAAKSDPSAASNAHRAAIGLREGLYRIFAAVVSGSAAPAGDLDRLNRVAAGARALQRLAPSGPNFGWCWSDETLDLDGPAFLVALGACELLTREDLSRVNQCPAPDGCGWLFFDETKNRSRKWCSMDQCGALAKSRRFAERHARA